MVSKTISDEWKRQLQEISRGANEALRNAEQLFQEAETLKKSGALSRTLFLHQVSLEECAKVELLCAWASGLIMGHEIDTSRLAKAMANHKAKNHINAYMMEVSEEEKSARKRSDWKGAMEAFRQQQERFHQKSNTAKNAALYVDFVDEKFVTPREQITLEKVEEISKTNDEYLALMQPKVKLLSKWNASPDEAQKELVELKELMIKLSKELPDDPEKAMGIMLDKMLAERSQGK